MRLLDLTLETAAENLALDEALLDQVSRSGGVLRLWEPTQPVVILGRASRVADEVNMTNCRAKKIPVLRRCSGGATVVALPGCLMYAVVLPMTEYPELVEVDRAHGFVLTQIRRAFRLLDVDVSLAGSSDLTWQNRKFSGNSLRCKREGLLYHGTLLYQADLRIITQCLKMPPRQPDYRQQRPHRDFLTNLGIAADRLRAALRTVWAAEQPLHDWPRAETEQLAEVRYAQDSWNLQR